MSLQPSHFIPHPHSLRGATQLIALEYTCTSNSHRASCCRCWSAIRSSPDHTPATIAAENHLLQARLRPAQLKSDIPHPTTAALPAAAAQLPASPAAHSRPRRPCSHHTRRAEAALRREHAAMALMADRRRPRRWRACNAQHRRTRRAVACWLPHCRTSTAGREPPCRKQWTVLPRGVLRREFAPRIEACRACLAATVAQPEMHRIAITRRRRQPSDQIAARTAHSTRQATAQPRSTRDSRARPLASRISATNTRCSQARPAAARHRRSTTRADRLAHRSRCHAAATVSNHGPLL